MSIISNESWFSRLTGSLKGIAIGGLISLVAFPLLFWNEGRAVHRAQTLADGRGAVQDNVSNQRVDSSMEGKLVHMTGTAESTATLTDEKFAISVDNAIRLDRVVEMFQWQENEKTQSKKKVGGGRRTTTTFEYERVWSSSPIDSRGFQQSEQERYGSGNPPMPFASESYVAPEVNFGAFKLSKNQIDRINSAEPVQLAQPKVFEFNSEDSKPLKLVDNQYYQSDDPSNPRVGDIRIKFTTIGPTDVSFIYQQQGRSFVPQKFSQGTIALFSEGSKTADELFTEAETANNMLLWGLRLGGILMMAFGIGLILRPLAVLSDVIPFLGGLVGFGVAIIALLVAGALSLVTISIAWLFYRPLLAITLLVIAAVMIFLARRFLRQNRSNVIEIDQPVVLG